MTIGLVGRKCGMTRVFTDAGVTVPVTVVEALPNRVTQIKSEKPDGYRAVQVTFGARKASRVPKALAGHFAKANVAAGYDSHEFRLVKGEGEALTAGTELKVDIFTAGQVVDVTGTTVGKGFAGTMKRHNFAGGMKTHGNSVSHRAPGSIGQRQTPGRVFKGKRMSGHMGVRNRTIENLRIVEIDEVRASLGPQHVARMTIAMQTQPTPGPAGIDGRCDGLDSLRGNGLPGGLEVRRNQVAGEQEAPRFVSKVLQRDFRPGEERRLRPDRVQATQEVAHALEHAGAIQLGGPTAAAREQGEAESLVRVQGRTIAAGQRRHDRDILFGEFTGKRMLFQQLRFRPALRAIELGDHAATLLQSHLPYPVFVGIERQQPTVAAHAERLEGVEQEIGRQSIIGMHGCGYGLLIHELRAP